MSGANGTRRRRLPIRIIKPLHIKASLVPTVRNIVIEMEDHLDHPNQHQQQEEQPTATNVDSTEGTQADTRPHVDEIFQRGLTQNNSMRQYPSTVINSNSSHVEEDVRDQDVSRNTLDSRPVNITNVTQSDNPSSVLILLVFLPFIQIQNMLRANNEALTPILIFNPTNVGSNATDYSNHASVQSLFNRMSISPPAVVMSAENQINHDATSLPGFDSSTQSNNNVTGGDTILNSTYTTPTAEIPFIYKVLQSILRMKELANQRLMSAQEAMPIAGPSGSNETVHLYSTSVSTNNECSRSDSVCPSSASQQVNDDASASGSSVNTTAGCAKLIDIQCSVCHMRFYSANDFLNHIQAHCSMAVGEGTVNHPESIASGPTPPMEMTQSRPEEQQPDSGANFGTNSTSEQRSSDSSTQQALPVQRAAGVGGGGHGLEDLDYCPHCRMYLVNVNVYDIYRLTNFNRFERVCSFCNERLENPGELALHLLHQHIHSQHEEAEVEEPSDGDDADVSSASKKPRRSDDPSVG